MAGDWIRYHRKAKHSECFRNPNDLKVWIWCLGEANWKAGKFMGHIVSRGEFITSYSHASKELSMSRSTVRRCLERLEGWGQVETKPERRWTRISVCNYCTYQDADGEGETQPERNRNATGPNRRRKERNSLVSFSKEKETSPDKSGDGTGFVFPLQKGTFTLPAKRLAEYRAAYPFDITRELLKAAGWMRDNKPRRSATARGCQARITAWLNRTADKHTGNGQAPTGRVVNDAGRLAEKKHAAAVRRLKARGVEVTDAAVKKELSKDAPA